MQLNRLRGFHSRAPGVYPLEDTGEVKKQRIDSAALQRISCNCVGSLSSVALFRCIFSFGTFFGIIRVYTIIFSDPCGFNLHKFNLNKVSTGLPPDSFSLHFVHGVFSPACLLYAFFGHKKGPHGR